MNLSSDTVSSLSRTCRHLRAITLPELYRLVHIRNHKADSFSSALTRNPSFADYVISLTIYYHTENESDDDPQFLYAEALTPIITRLPRLQTLIIKGTNFRDRYQYDIDTLGIDNLNISVRASLLEAAKEQRRESAGFQEAFQRTPKGAVLGSLRTCELNFSDRAPWDLSKRSAIFLHPTLKSLTIVGGYMEDFSLLDKNKARTFSTVLQELTFLSSHLTPLALREVLSLPKALQKFTLKGFGGQLPHHTHPERKGVMDALEQQRQSLRGLELSFPFPSSDVNSPVNLRAFANLEDVAISPRLLELGDGDGAGMGGQVSPPKQSPFPGSVRRLHFLDPHRQFIWAEGDRVYLSVIARWVKDGELPNLKSVAFTSLDGRFPENVGGVLTGTKVAIQRMEPKVNWFGDIECWCCRVGTGASLRF
ncbi:hypothetical protein BJY04DRAFT_213609 [Aspergillus karnatakaensis]|uniref:uncharacterized protein n=1 Tax=Aspergillus karnatakaensis TaxID=1810916 RepID=UPI003CCDBA4F